MKKDLVTVYQSVGKPYSFTFGDIVYVRRRVKPNRYRTEWITVKTSARRKLEVDSMSYGYNRYYDKILELTVPQIRKGFLEDKVADVEVPPDVVAFFEFNGERETPVHSGYRPGHLVTDDYVTTGVHRYFETDVVPPDGIATGTITFITPDLYPNSLWKGKKLQIMEGARIVGYATIRQVLNPILDKDQHL